MDLYERAADALFNQLKEAAYGACGDEAAIGVIDLLDRLPEPEQVDRLAVEISTGVPSPIDRRGAVEVARTIRHLNPWRFRHRDERHLPARQRLRVEDEIHHRCGACRRPAAFALESDVACGRWVRRPVVWEFACDRHLGELARSSLAGGVLLEYFGAYRYEVTGRVVRAYAEAEQANPQTA